MNCSLSHKVMIIIAESDEEFNALNKWHTNLRLKKPGYRLIGCTVAGFVQLEEELLEEDLEDTTEAFSMANNHKNKKQQEADRKFRLHQWD